MFRLLVDFNEVRRDRVQGLQRYAEGSREIRVGDTVLVHDDGSEEALGRVELIAGELIRVAVEWSTFGPAGRFRYVKPGVWLAGPAEVVVGHKGQPKPQVHLIGTSNSDFLLDPDRHSVVEPV
jgi:hypothetical protein